MSACPTEYFRLAATLAAASSPRGEFAVRISFVFYRIGVRTPPLLELSFYRCFPALQSCGVDFQLFGNGAGAEHMRTRAGYSAETLFFQIRQGDRDDRYGAAYTFQSLDQPFGILILFRYDEDRREGMSLQEQPVLQEFLGE